VDHAGDQVVGQGPRGRGAPDAAVDAGGLEDADDDGEAAVAFHFLQHDDLLVVDFADNDPLQFHLDLHGRPSLASSRRSKDGPPRHALPIGIKPDSHYRTRKRKGSSKLTATRAAAARGTPNSRTGRG